METSPFNHLIKELNEIEKTLITKTAEWQAKWDLAVLSTSNAQNRSYNEELQAEGEELNYLKLEKLRAKGRIAMCLRDNHLPQSLIKEEEVEGGLICAICQDVFMEWVTITRTSCNHKFHPRCILKWVVREYKTTCPLCMRSLGTKKEG